MYLGAVTGCENWREVITHESGSKHPLSEIGAETNVHCRLPAASGFVDDTRAGLLLCQLLPPSCNAQRRRGPHEPIVDC
jgi:hypothetical protein